jgi:acetyl esterase/lipase
MHHHSIINILNPKEFNFRIRADTVLRGDKPMKIEEIHPELRSVIRFVPSLPFHRRLFVKFINFLERVAPEKKVVNGLAIEKKELSHASVRIFRQEGELPGAGLLWIHGGGLISGRAAQDDLLCASYARDLGLVVVSVDYRLAPQYPFPAAIDDCYEAWQWFISEAQNLGVDPARIAVSGQSAGGGLAASLTQRISDEGGVQPSAQALFCPMLDDRTAANKELDSINHRIWTNKSNRSGWSCYLGHPPGVAEVSAYAVPARRKDLSNLPPAWISVGDIDLFYEEDRLYSQRLCEAGVDCQLYVVPMAPHAFETFVPKASITQDLYRDNYRFLRDSLGL